MSVQLFKPRKCPFFFSHKSRLDERGVVPRWNPESYLFVAYLQKLYS